MANENEAERLYDWLLRNGHTSEVNAHTLASLPRRSGTVIPDEMRRDGKLLTFFEDRPNLFGIVRGTDEARNVSIYAIDFRQEYRDRPAPRGRGGLTIYQNRADAAREAAEIDDLLRQATSPDYRSMGGKYKSKSKSKSKSRSAKKSRSRINRNRRSKSKSRN
jgi:hypothetical protein